MGRRFLEDENCCQPCSILEGQFPGVEKDHGFALVFVLVFVSCGHSSWAGKLIFQSTCVSWAYASGKQGWSIRVYCKIKHPVMSYRCRRPHLDNLPAQPLRSAFTPLFLRWS